MGVNFCYFFYVRSNYKEIAFCHFLTFSKHELSNSRFGMKLSLVLSVFILKNISFQSNFVPSTQEPRLEDFVWFDKYFAPPSTTESGQSNHIQDSIEDDWMEDLVWFDDAYHEKDEEGDKMDDIAVTEIKNLAKFRENETFADFFFLHKFN